MSVLLRASAISLFLTLASPVVVFAQSIDLPATDSATILTVSGDVAKSLDLSIADLVKLPQTKFSYTGPGENEGAEFDGPSIETVLALAGVKFDGELRGNLLATYLLVESTDGARVVFSLPEIDSSSGGRDVMLVLRRDGRALGESEGPIRIVVSGDTRKARWVKHVRKLTVVRARSAG